MKKIISLLVVLTIAVPNIVLAQSQQLSEEELFTKHDAYIAQGQDSNIIIADLMTEIERAKQDVRSVFQDASFYITLSDTETTEVSQFMADMAIFYNDNQAISQGHVIFETINPTESSYQEVIFPNEERGKGLYVRYTAEGEFENLAADQEISEEYTVNPEYLELVEIIQGLENDLIVEETDDAYLLTLANEDTKLFSLFQAQFDLNLSGLDPNEMDKKALFAFNKDNYYLEYILLDFSYETEGQAMQLNVQTNFQDWNQVDEGMIDEMLDSFL